MADASDGDSPLMDKIPAEIRLLIYEEVLRFEYPVTKDPGEVGAARGWSTTENEGLHAVQGAQALFW